MTYKDYYKELSKIEERLFDEGYWKFIKPSNVDEGLVYSKQKFGELLFCVFWKKRVVTDKIITWGFESEKDILHYMDNPNSDEYVQLRKVKRQISRGYKFKKKVPKVKRKRKSTYIKKEKKNITKTGVRKYTKKDGTVVTSDYNK